VEGFRHPNLIGMRIFGGRSVSGERVVSHRGCQNGSCQTSRAVRKDV
jgi:hypothetical protein